MELDDSKYSKYMEYGHIKSVLRRKYKLSYIEAFRTCEYIKPIHKNAPGYDGSFIINKYYKIHYKDVDIIGCRYYIEAI